MNEDLCMLQLNHTAPVVSSQMVIRCQSRSKTKMTRDVMQGSFNMNIKITKSKRKTISISIKNSDEVSVRAPYWMKKADIQTYIEII